MFSPLIKGIVENDAYRTRNPGRGNRKNDMDTLGECSASEDVPDGFVQVRRHRRRPRPLPVQPVALARSWTPKDEANVSITSYSSNAPWRWMMEMCCIFPTCDKVTMLKARMKMAV